MKIVSYAAATDLNQIKVEPGLTPASSANMERSSPGPIKILRGTKNLTSSPCLPAGVSLKNESNMNGLAVAGSPLLHNADDVDPVGRGGKRKSRAGSAAPLGKEREKRTKQSPATSAVTAAAAAAVTTAAVAATPASSTGSSSEDASGSDNDRKKTAPAFKETKQVNIKSHSYNSQI